MFVRPRAVTAALLCLCVAVVAGCGSSSTKVSGKVTYQGRPVVWGSVTLMDAKGQYYQAEIKPDGTYTIDDAVPTGTVKIGVVSPKPAEDVKPETKEGGPVTSGLEDPRARFKKQSGPVTPPPPPGAWLEIPSMFSDPTKSGLTGEVKKGAPLDIELK